MDTHKRMWVAVSVILILSMLAIPGFTGAAAQGPEPIKLRVQTPHYQLDASGPRVPGYLQDRTPGAPMLPVYQTVVELPAGGEWRLEIATPGAQMLAAVDAIPAAAEPDPAREAPRTSSNVDELPAEPALIVRPDPAIYSSDAFYPSEPVIAGEVQWQRGSRFVPLRVYPFQYNPVSGALRYLPDISIEITIAPDTDAASSGASGLSVPDGAQANPPAVNGNALRIYTGQRGMHRLTYSDLSAAGVPLASVNVSTFAMYYLGEQIDIQVVDRNGNGLFNTDDLVVFYAEPYEGRFMTRNVYWFSYGTGGGARMQTRQQTPTGSEPVVTTITQSARVEVDKVYVSEIYRPMDEDHYYDDSLYPNVSQPTVTRTYNLALDDLITTGSATLRARVYGGTVQGAATDQSVALRVNGNSAGVFQWKGQTGNTATQTIPGSWLSSNTAIVLEAALSQLPGFSYYWIYPDWVELTYAARADAEADRIYVEAAPAGANKVEVTGFSSPSVRVYDIRDPRRPVQLTSMQSQPAGGAYTVHFWDADLPNPRYFLATEGGLIAPVAVQPDTPSNWLSPTQNASYIAIVHPDLWNAVQPLLNHRQAEGLAVAKVNVQDIYDEVSYGRVDPAAIKSFLAYAYQNWRSDGSPPDFVLVVGDGHGDFKNAEGSTLKNLIPPYLVHVDPWIGETASDNRYVSIDGPNDRLPEMHIGRISAQNAAEVTNVINKVLAYENSVPSGSWQSKVAFIADDCNDRVGDFNAISELVRQNWLPSQYSFSRTYFRKPVPGDNCPNANYSDPAAMKNAIKNVYNGQNLLLQWFGHGSRFRWGYSDSLFNYADVATLAPNSVWPLVMHYTCYTGYFHNIYMNLQSLAETELNTASRGSVASFAASGQHLGTDELVMNYGINQALLYDRLPRIGQVIDSARYYYFANSPAYLDLIDSSLLFGDPALKVRLPATVVPDHKAYLPFVVR